MKFPMCFRMRLVHTHVRAHTHTPRENPFRNQPEGPRRRRLTSRSRASEGLLEALELGCHARMVTAPLHEICHTYAPLLLPARSTDFSTESTASAFRNVRHSPPGRQRPADSHPHARLHSPSLEPRAAAACCGRAFVPDLTSFRRHGPWETAPRCPEVGSGSFCVPVWRAAA